MRAIAEQLDRPKASGDGVAGEDELTLADYLGILRRQRRVILAVLVLVIVAAAALTSVQDRVYRAHADVLVRTTFNQQLFPVVGANANSLLRTVDAELEYATSGVFESSVLAATPPGVDVDVDRVGDRQEAAQSGLLRFSASGGDAEEVAAAANLWAAGYVDARHELTRSEVTMAIERDETLLADLRSQRDEILAPLEPLDEAIEETEDPEVLSGLLAQRVSLQQTLSSSAAPLEVQISQLNSALAGNRLTLTYLDDPRVGAFVSSEAEPPAAPAEPSWPRNLALAAVVGLVLAVGAGLMRESLTDRLDEAEAVQRVTGLPILAEVPRYDADAEPLAPAGSSAIERYRDVATSLELLAAEAARPYVVLVTSDVEGVGKTTVAANTARQLAAEGRTVLVLSGDLRRPALEDLFRVPSRPGLVEVLEGTVAVGNAMQLVEDELFVLPSGRVIGDPGVLLRVGALHDVRTQVAKDRMFDVVIIDSPPVPVVSDAVRLAAVSDAIVVVARIGQSRRSAMAEMQSRLTQVEAPVVGVVVTGTRSVESRYYRSGGEDGTAITRRRRR